jgi:hypothetical protein
METLDNDTAPHPSSDLEQTPELSRFTPYIGDKFDVSLPQTSLQIELVEAKALPGHAGEPCGDSFALVFKAANDCGLVQGPVAIDHEKVGWVVMFLVLIGEDHDSQYFEAIFN